MPKAECWKIFGHQDCLHNCPRIKSMWICSGILIVVPSKCHHCRDQQRYDAHCLDWAECQASLKKKGLKRKCNLLGVAHTAFFWSSPKKETRRRRQEKKVSYVDGRNPAPVDIRNAPAPCWGRPVSQGYMNLALAEWGVNSCQKPAFYPKKKGLPPALQG